MTPEHETREILRRLDGHGEKLDQIKVQVERTNGRVTVIEKWVERAKGIIAFCVLLVPATLIYVLPH